MESDMKISTFYNKMLFTLLLYSATDCELNFLEFIHLHSQGESAKYVNKKRYEAIEKASQTMADIAHGSIEYHNMSDNQQFNIKECVHYIAKNYNCYNTSKEDLEQSLTYFQNNYLQFGGK